MELDADADGTQLSDLKILSHFKIRDALGNITTQHTDEHAMFDVGLWIDNATHVKLDRVSVVGYWQKAGCFWMHRGGYRQPRNTAPLNMPPLKIACFRAKSGSPFWAVTKAIRRMPQALPLR